MKAQKSLSLVKCDRVQQVVKQSDLAKLVESNVRFTRSDNPGDDINSGCTPYDIALVVGHQWKQVIPLIKEDCFSRTWQR